MSIAFTRRTGLGLAAALAATGSGRAAAPSGFRTRAEILRAFVRLRGALDGRIVFWWLEDVRSAVVGTRMYPLYRARIGTFLRSRQVGPDAYAFTTLESSYATSLESDQLAVSITNPVTGATIETPSVLLGPHTTTLRLDGAELPPNVRGGTYESRLNTHGPVSVVGDDVFIAEDAISRVVFPPPTPPYNTSELNVYRGRLSELKDPDRPYLAAWVSYQSVSAFQARHKMDGIVGHISARAIGAKVKSLDEMPNVWRALAEQNHPAVLRDIAGALDRSHD